MNAPGKPNNPICDKIRANDIMVSLAPICPVEKNLGISKAMLTYPRQNPEYMMTVFMKPCRAKMPIMEN